MTIMLEQLEDYIEQAIHQVEAWDLPEEQFVQAVNDQARLMAGIDLDDRNTGLEIRLHTALRF
jgi:hypothetical protein